MTSALDSNAQMSLLTFGQTSLLASFNLPVYVYVSLQCLKIFVVKKGYVGSILKNLCHYNFLSYRLLIPGWEEQPAQVIYSLVPRDEKP